MGKIQELSVQLANQIAAGEVVERPASVVKELLENAIDAGASVVEINIEEAGLKKIEIIDNGEGILSSDVEIAFKRHATSKIKNRDDLFRIATLGFRGEALPSIASVSKIKIETASADENVGTIVEFVGGKLVSRTTGQLRIGTKITVENLFFNTPARLKYVKSVQTEYSAIVDVITKIAFANPKIAITLNNNGKTFLKTPGNGNLLQLLANVYGLSVSKKMVEIKGSNLDFEIDGYVSLPEVTRSNRNFISILINGRYIKNYALNAAIVRGYGSKLMQNRFPIAVLNIKMDPILSDINVHPSKQEIRLSKEKELSDLIIKTISSALGELNLIPEAMRADAFKRVTIGKNAPAEQGRLDFDAQQSADESSPREGGRNKEISTMIFDTDFSNGAAIEKKNGGNNASLKFDLEKGFYNDSATIVTDSHVEELPAAVRRDENFEVKGDFKPATQEKLKDLSKFEMINEDPQKPEAHEVLHAREKVGFAQFDYIGQFHGTYLLAQNIDGLYIVDQHAAQERINYEKYRKEIGQVNNDQKVLLTPIILEYSPSELVKIRSQLDKFKNYGISIEEFDAKSLVIREVPVWLHNQDAESAIRDIIATIIEKNRFSIEEFLHELAVSMSCKRSIKANHNLTTVQATQLISDLNKCGNPFNCPHGRPVIISFTNDDIEKLFKRIV
jgi:DNA mismatch repair protein MutL